jgi:hypothetical protein
MTLTFNEAVIQAASELSPLAEVILRDRPTNFDDATEFVDFYPLLHEDVLDLVTKRVNALCGV